MATTMTNPSNVSDDVDHNRGVGEQFRSRSGQQNRIQSDVSEPWRHAEGRIAKTIEDYTAQMPSDTFLWAAGASIVGSLTLQVCGRSHAALLVGQLAPAFLLLGIYNKIVKVAGSDRAVT